MPWSKSVTVGSIPTVGMDLTVNVNDAAGVTDARTVSTTHPAGGWYDWRTHPTLLPPGTQVVMGISTGDKAGFDAHWGATTRLQRVYDGAKGGGTYNSLNPITSGCQGQLNAGVVPAVDWNYIPALGSAGFTVNNIGGVSGWQWVANGGMDEDGLSPTGKAYKGIKSWANAVKALTKGACPTNMIIFTTCHEMGSMTEGGGYGGVRAGSPTEYGAAHRHIVNVFAAQGVTNVTWGFNFAGSTTSLGTTYTDTGSDGYYPGHLFCDIVGWDPYNMAGLTGHLADPWRLFTPINNQFGQLAWWNSHFTIGAPADGAGPVYKPVCLFEFGTVDDNTAGTGTQGNAEGWFDDLAVSLAGPSFSGIIRYACYFNDPYMTVLNNPSHRWTGTAGRGTHAVYATII